MSGALECKRLGSRGAGLIPYGIILPRLFADVTGRGPQAEWRFNLSHESERALHNMARVSRALPVLACDRSS